MEHSNQGAVTAGARLLLRGWRTLLLAYVVNLLLGIAAGLPLASGIAGILNSSLESERLVKGFDLGTFFGLLMHPEFTLSTYVLAALFVTVLYLVFTLFLTGGLLADYRSEQRVAFSKLFEASGEFFWRFVRLLLFLMLTLVPVGIFYVLLDTGTDKLAENAPGEAFGFKLGWACVTLTLVLFIVIRLWFDVAQIRAVAENERKMRRALGKSFRITFGNFFSLFWIFLRIAIVALAGSAAAAWLFVRVIRPEQVGLSIVWGQVVVVFWLAIRLWLRASETVWYQRKFPAPVVFAEAPPLPLPEFEPLPAPAAPESPSEPASAPPPVAPTDDSSS